MLTQAIHEPAIGLPWLEHYPPDGGPAERIPLDSFPFAIGRNESADLQIDSSRVSREHAVILREGGSFKVRDLGSTNGTLVNGRQIEEIALADGDILVFANLEYGFFSRHSRTSRTAATQVMESDPPDADREKTSKAVICQVRRLQEMLTQRAVENLYQPVIGLQGGQILGYEAIGQTDACNGDRTDLDRLLAAAECRLTGRLRHLHRMMAAEEMAALPADLYVFLSLERSEIGSDCLIESLGRLRDVLAAGPRLVVGMPDGTACDLPHGRDFRSRLQSLDIAVAYDGFTSSHRQLMEHAGIRPDFIRLAEVLVRAIHLSREHQRQVQSLLHASREIGCQVIATGIRTKDEAETCRQLGCRLGQGDYFGHPQPIDSLVNLAESEACVSH